MRPLVDRDAAITGASAFTPLGHGLAATWDALAAGRRVAPPVARIDEPFLRARVPEELESQSKFLNGAGRLATEATTLAIEDGRLHAAGHEPTAKGLYLAALDLTLADFAAYHEPFREATDGFSHAPVAETLNVLSQRKMNPFYLLETLNNNAFSFLSVWHGLHGANTGVSGWMGPGLAVASLAARAVSRGDASAAVACGVGRGTGAVSVLEIERLRLLPRGVVPSEGAAALVLEPLGDARTRGAKTLAVVAGSCATFGAGARRPDAVRSAVAAACEEAGITSADVGALYGPPDACAAVATRGVRVETREATGEMGAGSEVSDLALAAAALARGVLPDGKPAGSSALVVTSGPDGQSAAVVLVRVR